MAIACILIASFNPFRAAALKDETRAAREAASVPGTGEIRFTGEAVRGQPFTRDVGHNLTFRLTPAASDEGGGWVIEIFPLVDQPDDPVELSTIATPPYHAYNDRYVAGAFGYSTKEAIKTPLRKFYFVQSVNDEHIANEVVNAALFPSTVSEADKLRISEEAAGVKLGRGELRILHSRITPGKGEPDTIAWMKFEVVLDFSPGVTLQDVLAPKPPAAR